MPVSRNAHHAQLFATPPARTKLVTRFGVSVLNVVATIDTPMSHHGAARPDVKNSAAHRRAGAVARPRAPRGVLARGVRRELERLPDVEREALRPVARVAEGDDP